jgi:hypothetical protein
MLIKFTSTGEVSRPYTTSDRKYNLNPVHSILTVILSSFDVVHETHYAVNR